MIEIYRAAHPVQAHLLRGLLEAEGIEAAVIGEFGFSVRGEAPVTTETLPRVCVEHEADVPRAREIAESFDKSEPLEGVELDGEFLALENPDPPEK
ncbi:MAG: DUF2007 domain-containing protein [Vicinamibacterales bacterium]